jgi:porin
MPALNVERDGKTKRDTGRSRLILYLVGVGKRRIGKGGTIFKGPVADATESAVQLKLQYTGEAWYNAGGASTGTNLMQGVDASLSIDASKFGWAGAKFYAEGFYVGGKSLDLQRTDAWSGPSALDTYFTNNSFRLYQMFYEQRIAHTGVLIGLYDVQQQFGATQPTEVFFNRTFGMNTPMSLSGVGGGGNGAGTYPNTTVGLRIKQEINDQWTAKFGLLNGLAQNPNAPQSSTLIVNSQTGLLAIGEIDYTPFARTKLMAGYWGYTSKFTTIDVFGPGFAPHYNYGTSGGYVGAATRIYTIAGSRGVDAFVNLGAANSSDSFIDRTANGGVSITGLFAGRPHDKLGFGYDIIGTGQPYQNLMTFVGTPIPKYEQVFELTYRASINDWLVIQPDIQYIVDPILAPTHKSAIVFGLHLELSKLFNML